MGNCGLQVINSLFLPRQELVLLSFVGFGVKFSRGGGIHSLVPFWPMHGPCMFMKFVKCRVATFTHSSAKYSIWSHDISMKCIFELTCTLKCEPLLLLEIHF